MSFLCKSVPEPIMPPSPLLETLVPRQRWHLLRAELRWAYRGRTHQQHSNRWFHTPHTSAWLILEGSARVRTASGQCSANAGEWLIAPPGERWQHASADCQILSICFVWHWIFGRELFPLTAPIKLASSDVPYLKPPGLQLAKKAGQFFPGARTHLPERDGPLGAHLELENAFGVWLLQYYRALMHRGIRPCMMTLDPRVEQAVQIFDRPGRNPPRPAELSKQLSLSQGQLNRLFLRDLGTTLREYGERQKLASARGHLQGSQLSVKETAFRLGFLSPQHFSRWFRQRTGVSPTQLRRANPPMI